MCSLPALTKDAIIVIEQDNSTTALQRYQSYALFNIYISNDIYNGYLAGLKSHHIKVSKASNRYMSICGRLYPVYISPIDRVFTAEVDSMSLYYRCLWLRQLLSIDGVRIYADLDNSVYYINDDFDKPMGRRSYQKDKLRLGR